MYQTTEKIVKKKRIEFSKIIMFMSMIESWVALGLVIFLTIKYNFDAILSGTILTLSWASYTTGKALYYNKAKAENIYKLRLEFLKFKIKNTNSNEQIDSELNEIDSTFKTYFDNLENENIESGNV